MKMIDQHIGKVYLDYSNSPYSISFYLVIKKSSNLIKTAFYETFQQKVDTLSKKKTHNLVYIPNSFFKEMGIVDIPSFTIKLKKRAMAEMV